MQSYNNGLVFTCDDVFSLVSGMLKGQIGMSLKVASQPFIFRQWKAQSHCNKLHSYQLQFSVCIKRMQHNPRYGEIMDKFCKFIRGLPRILIDKNDPHADLIVQFAKSNKPLYKYGLFDAVGCERISQYCFDTFLKMHPEHTKDIYAVFCAEHAGNFAGYGLPLALSKTPTTSVEIPSKKWQPTDKVWYSGKVYPTTTGLSHVEVSDELSTLNGGALGVGVIFMGDALNECEWLVDFGSMKSFKGILEQNFDHTFLLPERLLDNEFYLDMKDKGLIDIRDSGTGYVSYTVFSIAHALDSWRKSNGYENVVVGGVFLSSALRDSSWANDILEIPY